MDMLEYDYPDRPLAVVDAHDEGLSASGRLGISKPDLRRVFRVRLRNPHVSGLRTVAARLGVRAHLTDTKNPTLMK